MELRAGEVMIHYTEHGAGRPRWCSTAPASITARLRLVRAGFPRRSGAAIYPDLPGMGRTIAPETLRSADDVLDTLLGFAAKSAASFLLIGHSAGAYYAQAMA